MNWLCQPAGSSTSNKNWIYQMKFIIGFSPNVSITPQEMQYPFSISTERVIDFANKMDLWILNSNRKKKKKAKKSSRDVCRNFKEAHILSKLFNLSESYLNQRCPLHSEPHLANSSLLAQLDDQEVQGSRLTPTPQTAALEQPPLPICPATKP